MIDFWTKLTVQKRPAAVAGIDDESLFIMRLGPRLLLLYRIIICKIIITEFQDGGCPKQKQWLNSEQIIMQDKTHVSSYAFEKYEREFIVVFKFSRAIIQLTRHRTQKLPRHRFQNKKAQLLLKKVNNHYTLDLARLALK